jgi:hypothetical protein
MQIGRSRDSRDQQRAPYANETTKFHGNSFWPPGRFYKPDVPVRQSQLENE